MKVRQVSLENFRCIKNLDQKIDQDLIVLVGNNGVGKTSFLESIFYASVFLAFPPNKSWSLISHEQDFFRISINTEDAVLGYYYGKKNEQRYARSQTIDGVRKRASDMLGVLPVVAFLPQDLSILQFEPSYRREYLDDILLQTERGYEENLSELARVVRQRNELLAKIREGRSEEDELDFWDEKLSEITEFIVFARRGLANFLQSNLSELYTSLTKKEKELAFTYLPSMESDRVRMKAMFIKKRREDITSGRTSLGPHRDDWQIRDGQGRDLSQFLSRGEHRSIAICLKLKEFKFLTEKLKQNPILLLDELLAELDEERKSQVLQNLPYDSQVFLTTTTLNDIPKQLLNDAQVIELRND